MAKAHSTNGYGSGWHNQSLRHSKARLTGKAGGKYKSIYYPAHFQTEGGNSLSFNLYNEEGIDDEATKSNIINHFNKERLPALRKIYSEAGLEIQDTKYYSPSSYNFQGDSIDLKVKIKDKAKLLKFIEKNKTELQKRLDSNKSYDGYMALTKSSVRGVIEEIEEKGEIDPMVADLLNSKIKLDIYDDLYDLLEYEPEEGEN